MQNHIHNTILISLILAGTFSLVSATPREQLKKQLVGTSWYCDDIDIGLYFEDTLSCFLIKYFGCKCSQDKGYRVSTHWFYNCTNDSQVCLYDSEGHLYCDDGFDGFFCPELKLLVEGRSNSIMDLRCIWHDPIFVKNNPFPTTTVRFVRNRIFPIVENSFFEQSETSVVDSTIQIPKVEIRNQVLIQAISDFSKQKAIPSDSSPFLEARCHKEKDSLVVILTDEVTALYDEKTMGNSYIGVCGSVPILFVGIWPKQMIGESQGKYPITVSYCKHIKCNYIYYEPSDKYLRRGTFVKKKIAIKKTLWSRLIQSLRG